jgi:hypothetical protein
MAAPLDVTWAGALEEGVGWVIAAVEEGARVMPGADADSVPVTDEAAPEEGTTAEEGCRGAALLRGAETDAADEAGGAGGGAEADKAGGVSNDDTGAGGGAYEWPGGAGAGRPGVTHSLTVTVTVTAGSQVAARGVNVCYAERARNNSRSATTAQISAATAKSFMPNMLMAGMCVCEVRIG